jgi:hypothetical protein
MAGRDDHRALKIIGPLTDPTAYGGNAADAFPLVIPSVPGYAFSERPAEVGRSPGRVLRAWVALIKRLGYGRFVAAGRPLLRDWSASRE